MRLNTVFMFMSSVFTPGETLGNNLIDRFPARARAYERPGARPGAVHETELWEWVRTHMHPRRTDHDKGHRWRFPLLHHCRLQLASRTLRCGVKDLEIALVLFVFT